MLFPRIAIVSALSRDRQDFCTRAPAVVEQGQEQVGLPPDFARAPQSRQQRGCPLLVSLPTTPTIAHRPTAPSGSRCTHHSEALAVSPRFSRRQLFEIRCAHISCICQPLLLLTVT